MGWQQKALFMAVKSWMSFIYRISFENVSYFCFFLNACRTESNKLNHLFIALLFYAQLVLFICSLLCVSVSVCVCTHADKLLQ